jgi:hypothetical protein
MLALTLAPMLRVEAIRSLLLRSWALHTGASRPHALFGLFDGSNDLLELRNSRVARIKQPNCRFIFARRSFKLTI